VDIRRWCLYGRRQGGRHFREQLAARINVCAGWCRGERECGFSNFRNFADRERRVNWCGLGDADLISAADSHNYFRGVEVSIS
jgi:hypothetical protein